MVDLYSPFCYYYNSAVSTFFLFNLPSEDNMANQTFKVVGITVHGDDAKVRFTDDMIRRIKQFTKGGAARCEFIELPSEMTKLEALRYMATRPEFQSAADQATIADAIADREKEANKGTVKVKQTKAKTTKATPSLDSIKARAKKAKESVEVNTEVDNSENESVAE